MSLAERIEFGVPVFEKVSLVGDNDLARSAQIYQLNTLSSRSHDESSPPWEKDCTDPLYELAFLSALV